MFEQLDERLNQAIKEAGFTEPTPVQKETFEPALQGKDLFVSAETGSGKTAAYLLPTFERLLFGEPDRLRQIKALVLVPTRELAQQVLRHAKQIARLTELKLGLIGGGTDLIVQDELIKSPPDVLIATPGRLSKLLSLDLVDLEHVQTLVLDEADRLLDMGFGDEIMAIAAHCHRRQQTMLYSATLANKGLRGLVDELMQEPVVFALNQTSDPHSSIQHQILFADDLPHKFALVQWLLTHETYQQCLIFCNSKEHTDKLYGSLVHHGASVGILHGDRDQKQRNLVMSKLRRGELKVLVATDIAARGLDIEDIDLVINFEMPRRGDIYVHRIGRTGRAGKVGLAISLITAPEYNLMSGIERYLKQHFERRKIKEIEGNYKGPKKLKASGKAAGAKKKDVKKKDEKKKDVKKKGK